MSDSTLLDQALALALKLSTKQRLRLIEEIASSVEHEIDSSQSNTEHWGKNLLRLLDELGSVEFTHPEIDDPVDWVKQIRGEQELHRGLDWRQDE